MSKPIHLMHITHDLAIGGLQQVIVNICKNIDKKIYKVSVLCLRDLGPLADQLKRIGIKLILLPQNKNGTDYLSFIKVAKILNAENIDVIHTHNTQPLVDGVIGSIISGKRRRIIHTDHARQFPDKLRYMFAEWLVSHFADKIVGVSPQTTANLNKYELISQKKLTTIANGIDRNIYDITIDKKSYKRSLGVVLDGPILGVIARLEEVKGITYLLRALPQIIMSYPHVTLLIVGDGTKFNSLRNEASLLGIMNNVIFTGTRLDIPNILKLIDVYILPSLSEGLPMGLLEAMASGCAIVASNVGGIPSVVQHEVSALLTSPSKPHELANMTLKALGNPILHRKLSENAFKRFNYCYSVDQMLGKYCELYNENIIK